MKAILWIAAAALLVAMAAPTIAHHASAPFYDPEQRVEAVGEVTRFVFRNPHSFLYVDAPGDDGETIHWEIEMGAAVSMSRRGWTPATIQAGDQIKAVGQPLRARRARSACAAPS